MLFFLISSFFGVLVTVSTCLNMLYHNLKLPLKFALWAGCFIISLAASYYLGEYSTYLLIAYMLLIIFLNKQYPFINCLLFLMGYLIQVTLNYVCLLLTYIISGVNFSEFTNSQSMVFIVFYVILCCMITYQAGKWIHKRISVNYYIENKKLIHILIILVVSCAALFILNFSTSQQLGYPTYFTIINCFLFLSYFTLTISVLSYIIKSLKREADKKKKLIELKNLQEYTGRLEDLYQQMRSFKHDYINILATLDCYIEQRDLDGLDAYFHSKLLPTGKHFSQDTASFERLTNIRLLELKSLLYQKFIRASSLSLQLEIDIPNPLTSSGSVEPVDLSRLLGIFLDNAIESAAETDERYLYCGLLQNEDSLIICLTNSCRMEGIPIEKLYENGFTTKDTGHGIGLFNAKEILNNYPDIIHRTECKNERFTQELCIPQGTC